MCQNDRAMNKHRTYAQKMLKNSLHTAKNKQVVAILYITGSNNIMLANRKLVVNLEQYLGCESITTMMNNIVNTTNNTGRKT